MRETRWCFPPDTSSAHFHGLLRERERYVVLIMFSSWSVRISSLMGPIDILTKRMTCMLFWTVPTLFLLQPFLHERAQGSGYDAPL